MFISDAYAAAAPAVGEGGLGATLLQLALILLIFYFFLIRPQQKRIKEHNDMVEALKVGDRVLTNGGIYGRVTKLNGAEVIIEIAAGVEVVVDRMSVSGLAETQTKAPAKADKKVKAKTEKNKKGK